VIHEDMADKAGKMDTFFILDMMRLANQDKVREKKDAKIRQMAMQQKEKQASKGRGSTHSYSSGGFVGINSLAKGGEPKWAPTTRKQIVSAEEETHVVTSDNEMFILGLLKEQRQEEKDKKRFDQISEHSLACASEKKDLQKFEG